MAVEEIRAFNRFYTNLIGGLDHSRHLDTPFILTEARVLYESAHAPRTDAADLRVESSLDAGRLSRILARFEERALVTRGPSARDARRQRVELTPHGREAAALLEERSQQAVGALIERIPADERPRLTEVIRPVRSILRDDDRTSAVPPVVLRGPRPADLG